MTTLLFKQVALDNLGNFYLYNFIGFLEQFYNQICFLKFLAMVTIVTSLFLCFFYPLLPNFPTGNHYLFIYSPNVRSMSHVASHKGSFSLGTPTSITVCPVGSICSYSIMQDEGQFCLYSLIFTSGNI